MPQDQRPALLEPPSTKRIVTSVLGAAAVAVVVLVAFILPAEYGIDPTGIGGVFGLTAMTSSESTQTIEITNVVGGNEQVVEAEIPDFGDPVPLPNPEIYQTAENPAETETLTIEIPAGGETEIKTVLQTSKALMFSWETDRGSVYSDFHGHTPDAGPEFFVRYREHQEGTGDNGSLVAPFGGEHGWYWLNYNEHPVTITLTVTGFYDDIIDYGIFR